MKQIIKRISAIMSQIAILQLGASDPIAIQCILNIGEDIEKIEQLLKNFKK